MQLVINLQKDLPKDSNSRGRRGAPASRVMVTRVSLWQDRFRKGKRQETTSALRIRARKNHKPTRALRDEASSSSTQQPLRVTRSHLLAHTALRSRSSRVCFVAFVGVYFYILGKGGPRDFRRLSFRFFLAATKSSSYWEKRARARLIDRLVAACSSDQVRCKGRRVAWISLLQIRSRRRERFCWRVETKRASAHTARRSIDMEIRAWTKLSPQGDAYSPRTGHTVTSNGTSHSYELMSGSFDRKADAGAHFHLCTLVFLRRWPSVRLWRN